MKALFTSAVSVLLMLQISCATGSGSLASKNSALAPQSKTAVNLPTPEVAVMPMKEGILVAWKPIDDADGYFVYRESKDTKKLLGIGPKEAQGFIDRDPPETAAKYSVQAFKLSEPSEKQETQALPGTARQSRSDAHEKEANGMRVMFPM